MAKDTLFSKRGSLRFGNKLFILDKPKITGVINLSPESFYPTGIPQDERFEQALIAKVEHILPFCDLLDLGAVSTRPYAPPVTVEEEISRFARAIPVIRKHFPEAFLSVDTWRHEPAIAGIEMGACMVNDISGGSMDPELIPAVARMKVPYVFSHIQGTPGTMQIKPVYSDVVREVINYFAMGIRRLLDAGLTDLIIDPGFGFGKSVDHNYQLLKRLEEFKIFDQPLMVGFSRKSMIQKVLELPPDECLNGTTVLNTIALLKGADLLRVHDPEEARQALILVEKMLSV